MMRLADVIRPLTVEDFRAKFYGRQCFVIKRTDNHLADLLSVKDVEVRLNDGVASRTRVSLIGPQGAKIPSDKLLVGQTGQAWTDCFVDKARVRSLFEAGHSLVMHNMSGITPRVESLIQELERAFGAQADVHLYVSPAASATGYQAHRDQPQHKLYVQLVGSTTWVVFKGTDPRRAMPLAEARKLFAVDFETKMTPGSVLYMPPGVFHHACNPDGPRLSMSIPFYESPGSKPVDRTQIPLCEILARASAS